MDVRTGKSEALVSPGSVCTVTTDGEFQVYGYDGKDLTALLGPARSTDRFVRFRIPPEVSRIEVRCKERTKWTMTEMVVNGKEQPDPTPLEVPVGYEHPESLEDSMKRFIRSEVSRHYAEQHQAGTFEDEDDFDIEDEDPEFITPYEMHDMQEEAPLPEADTPEAVAQDPQPEDTPAPPPADAPPEVGSPEPDPAS